MPKPLLTKRRLQWIDQTIREAWLMQQQGRIDEADTAYRTVLAIKPHHFDALHSLALICHGRGNYSEALGLISSALKANPAYPEALSNYGLILYALGRHEEAVANFDRALALKPDYPEVVANRGNSLLKLGRIAEALACYDRAIARKPDYFAAHFNRGNALMANQQPAEAIIAYGHALAISPGHPDVLNNCGNALLRLGRPADALASYGEILTVAPNLTHAINNYGNALVALNRHPEAIAAFDRVPEGDPEYATARYNGAMARLACGDLRNGWPDYEWRWQVSQFLPQRRNFRVPQWLGREPLDGKTILLHAEQGYGDTIQFVRYAKLVAERGAKVIVEVPAQLTALIGTSFPSVEIAPRGAPLPPFDLHSPLLSLPAAFGTDVATIPADIPYIAAPQDRSAPWRERLDKFADLKVGLVWSGRPSHINDLNRSIPLARLAPMLRETPVTFVSLQNEVREADLALLDDLPLVRFDSSLTDFAETAAAIAQLDLVISVDTAVAHLAGAMGKPVWLLLPFAADFRWMKECTDSPWYPTARLFRQPALADWDSVIVGLRTAFTQLS